MLLILFCFAVCSCIALCFYSTWTYDYWEKRGVPYKKPFPLFGNFFDIITFRRTLEELGIDLYRKGEGYPFIGYYQFRTPGLLIRDPELVKEVLNTSFDCFHDTIVKVNGKLDPLLAGSVFMLNGDLWKAARSLLTPAFTLYKVTNQFPLMAWASREMIQYLEKEAPKHRPDGLKVSDIARKFFVDVVVRCGFGIIGNSFSETEAVLRNLDEQMTSGGLRRSFRLMLFMLIPRLPSFLTVRFMDTSLQNFFRQLIKELVLYRETNRVFRNDYLQMLMHVKYMGRTVKGKNIIRVAGFDIEFTDEDIASHSLLLFFSGSEKPSAALTFALYELAVNPDIQVRLRTEIDSVLRKYSGGLTYEAVQEMTFLDMVLNETLRKYPAFSSVVRICTKPCKLTLPNGGTFTLEEGTSVVIPTEALHMDPEHFPQPEKFDPERFSEERKTNIKDYTYLPFGEGPRQCLGRRFAQAEIKACLVAIVSHFDIQTTVKTPKQIVKRHFGFMVSVKGGVWLDFVRRN